jgi:hypothetical protein
MMVLPTPTCVYTNTKPLWDSTLRSWKLCVRSLFHQHNGTTPRTHALVSVLRAKH